MCKFQLYWEDISLSLLKKRNTLQEQIETQLTEPQKKYHITWEAFFKTLISNIVGKKVLQKINLLKSISKI